MVLKIFKKNCPFYLLLDGQFFMIIVCFYILPPPCALTYSIIGEMLK